MNIIVRVSLLVVILLLVGLAGLAYFLIRSPVVTAVGVVKTQPVAYSHQLHVGALGLDCRYCHTAVEVSNTASIPPTSSRKIPRMMYCTAVRRICEGFSSRPNINQSSALGRRFRLGPFVGRVNLIVKLLWIGRQSKW